MSDEKDVGKIVLSFFIGGVVGAAFGLLLAPSSGAETRRRIKAASLDAKDKTLEKFDSIKSEASNLVERGKERISGVKSQIHAAVEAGKDAYKEKKGELIVEKEEE
jgi:gas vesicle protein